MSPEERLRANDNAFRTILELRDAYRRVDMRNRALHEEWIATLPCKVLRCEHEMTVQENLKAILGEMRNQALEATS